MSKWPTVALGDVVDARAGFACGDQDTSGIIQVRMNNVTRDGHLDFSRIRRVPKEQARLEKFALRDGDVLFNSTNSPELVGKTALFGNGFEPMVYSNHFIRIRCKQELNPSYLTRYLNQQYECGYFRSRCRQWVNQAAIDLSSLMAIRIPLAPVREQRRIASILDQADALRAHRRDAIAHLADVAQAAFISIFGDPQINQERWPTTILGSIAAVQGGLQVSRVRDSYSFRAPYLRVANVMRGGLDLAEIKTIGLTAAELKCTKLLRDDLLVVEGHGNPNEIGRVAAWDGSVDEITHQNHLIRVRLRSAPESNFVLHYLNSKSGRRHLLRSAKTTSGLNTISTRQVKETPLFLPPPGELARFHEVTKAVESAQRPSRLSSTQLDALFASLQFRAFAGEL